MSNRERLEAIVWPVPESAGEDRRRQVEEWVRTSYTLVAPKGLAKVVIVEDS